MKKLIVTLSLLFVIGTVAGVVIVAVTDHYANKIKNTPAPVATITVTEANKTLAKQQATSNARYSKLQTQYDAQTVECQKGKVAYDKLTATLKVQTPAPTCQPGLTY